MSGDEQVAKLNARQGEKEKMNVCDGVDSGLQAQQNVCAKWPRGSQRCRGDVSKTLRCAVLQQRS